MKKKYLFFALLLIVSASVFNCNDLEDEVTTQNETKKTSDSEKSEAEENTNQGGIEKTVSKILKEYWGTWIQMDTGNEYYIDSEKIKKLSSYYSNTVATNINGYTLDGKNILKNGSTVYFRKGGSARSFSANVSGFSDSISARAFSATVSGFSDSRAARALSTGKQGISGRRQNTNNAEDSQTATSDENGRISFTDAVADDAQKITVENTSVEVAPKYDGENVGTIPIVEEGTYGFKTTYSINGDSQGFCFGNDCETYTLKLDLNNIGSEMCETSVYSVSCADSNLRFVSGDLTGNFSSIEAGGAKKLEFKVRYGNLDREYADVPINISIQDSKYERTWEDSITLRFYKGVARLKVNSRNFDKNSSAKLKGFLIYPDGRSQRFEVGAENESVVLVPWSEKDYALVFSGATISNEMAYSFGFADKTSLADLSSTWSISDIKAYEPNDSISGARRIEDLANPAKAYLKLNDIDFYTINCGSVDAKFEPVSVTAYQTKEYENGNGDLWLVNPGESHYLNIKMHNTTKSEISGVTAKLSATSSYVTIPQSYSSRTIGNMRAGYYYSLDDNRSEKENECRMSFYLAERLFRFKVSSDCPSGTLLPFAVSFTDSSGNTWTDTFNIKVN